MTDPLDSLDDRRKLILETPVRAPWSWHFLAAVGALLLAGAFAVWVAARPVTLPTEEDYRDADGRAVPVYDDHE